MEGEERAHTGAAREASKERGGSWRRCPRVRGGRRGCRVRESEFVCVGTLSHKGRRLCVFFLLLRVCLCGGSRKTWPTWRMYVRGVYVCVRVERESHQRPRCPSLTARATGFSVNFLRDAGGCRLSPSASAGGSTPLYSAPLCSEPL